MADRATTPASPFRNRGKFSVCVVLRLAYDPHPIPGGLLPRRHLRLLSGIFPHVADREPLGLDLLLHFLLSHLEYIRFRPDSPSFLRLAPAVRFAQTFVDFAPLKQLVGASAAFAPNHRRAQPVPSFGFIITGDELATGSA